MSLSRTYTLRENGGGPVAVKEEREEIGSGRSVYESRGFCFRVSGWLKKYIDSEKGHQGMRDR